MTVANRYLKKSLCTKCGTECIAFCYVDRQVVCGDCFAAVCNEMTTAKKDVTIDETGNFRARTIKDNRPVIETCSECLYWKGTADEEGLCFVEPGEGCRAYATRPACRHGVPR